MLSFELRASGALEVYFDAAGRDLLLSALADVTEPGDHLFGPQYGGTELSAEVHHAENRPVQQVVLGIPGLGLQSPPGTAAG